MGLFDGIKNGEVRGKTQREGYSAKGAGKVLCRLESTSLWSKKNLKGQPTAGHRRFKLIAEIAGFDKDASIEVNTNTGKDGFKNPKYRAAEPNEKISLLACEESRGYQEFGDALRFALYAVACGVLNVDEGVASTPDGRTDDAALNEVTDAWFTDCGATKGTWFLGTFTYKPNKEEGKEGFTSFDALPLGEDDASEMLMIASGARDEGLSEEDAQARYQEFCVAQGFVDAEGNPVEGAENAATEYLRTLSDKAIIHKIVLGLGYTIAQRP